MIRLILSGLWKPILAALAALGFYAKIRSGDKAKAENKDLRDELEAHERLNNADTGIGATDSERIDRLRDFAARNSNRPAKGQGG